MIRVLPRSTTARSLDAARLFQLAALPIILGLQALLALSLRNTAFQDEALYLYAGRRLFEQMLGAAPADGGYAAYFSGSPYIYPVLAGAMDTWAGLTGARLLSVGLILATTFVVYSFTKELYDRDSALVAAGLFAVQGPVLFIGHLATYDAISVALLALAVLLGWRSGAAPSTRLSVLTGTLLALAVLTKYTAIIFIPTVLFILAWRAVRAGGWQRGLLQVNLSAIVMLVLAGSAIALAPDVSVGFTYNTLTRGIVIEMPRLMLLQRTLALSGGLLALGLGGLLLSGRARLPLSLVLLGSGILAPALHMYRAEYVSLHKHVAFGMLFVAPLAGY